MLPVTTVFDFILDGFTTKPNEPGPNQYRCAICGEIFHKVLTDAAAVDQLDTEFPGFAPDDCDLVCDVCFKKMGFGT